LFIAEMKQMCS